jgi:hypothetical protein
MSLEVDKVVELLQATSLRTPGHSVGAERTATKWSLIPDDRPPDGGIRKGVTNGP